ncbi:hypothetical protein HYFRA_00005548 [Hymenoscyphus fraxineus]|uniref:Uncharacterized protein n=1 Tax=Hymenoscyphus fraxineus TaxID=746836 RepID=A0A9N9KQV0_9HELO|nr:hypothetical protein HYFRA_00005548 [Hymenoscyphus fraxineus]
MGAAFSSEAPELHLPPALRMPEFCTINIYKTAEMQRARLYLWWEIDLSKQGLGDLGRIKTEKDLFDLAQGLDPRKSRYERRAIIEAVAMHILKTSSPPACSKSKSRGCKLLSCIPRKLKFSLKSRGEKDEVDPPIFMPDCICRSHDVGAGFRRHNMLPLQFFGQEYHNIGDIRKIPNPFYPDVSKGHPYNYNVQSQFSLIEKLMSLPAEIRYMIYEFVASSSHAPDITQNTARIFEIGVARRTKIPRSQPKYVLADEVAPAYFRASEYRNIEGFLEALRVFEGRQWCQKRSKRNCCTGELLDRQKLKCRRLGVLNDFLDWLWDSIVLDFTFLARKASFECTYGWGFNPNRPAPCPAQEHHLRIRHITITTPFGVNYTEVEKPFVTELKDFAYLCRYIKKNLRGLHSIRVFFRLREKQAKHFLGLKKEPEWLFEMNNNLPVLQKFEWYVSVVQNGTMNYEKGTEIKELTDRMIESLKKKLKPRMKPGFA